MPTKTKRPPLVEVTWLDAFVETDQVSRQKIMDEYTAVERHASGYLVYPQTDEEIVAEEAKGVQGRYILAQDFDPPDDFATVTVVPAVLVTKVRRRRSQRKRPGPTL